MLTDHHPASALPVRVGAVSVASVLLGVVAHGSIAGVLPRPGSLFVVALLVLSLVGALLAGGHSAGTWTRLRGWSVPSEDLSCLLALVAGQALVHWLVLPPGTPLGAGPATPPGHIHAVPLPPEALLAHHAAAATPAMLAVHAMAAVMVAAALRWVEAAILSLGQILRFVPAPMAWCVRAWRCYVHLGTAVSTLDHIGSRVHAWSSADARPRLRVTLLPLERRGPPPAGSFQNVLAT